MSRTVHIEITCAITGKDGRDMLIETYIPGAPLRNFTLRGMGKMQNLIRKYPSEIIPFLTKRCIFLRAGAKVTVNVGPEGGPYTQSVFHLEGY